MVRSILYRLAYPRSCHEYRPEPHGRQAILPYATRLPQVRLTEDVNEDERVRRREFPAITRLTQIGRLLIALRIAHGLTQRELAERLGISESLVSRDERNEYHGITVERAQRILDALDETVTTRVEEPPSRTRERELAGAA